VKRPSRYLNLDANASFPVGEKVLASLKEIERIFPNASAVHQDGQRAKYLIERSRSKVRELLKLKRDDRVVFTASATEANNQVLLTPVFEHYFRKKDENFKQVLLLGATEHPSITDVAFARWNSSHFNYKQIKCSKKSGLDGNSLIELLSEEVSLVSIMTANNETGEIFPVSRFVEVIKRAAPRALIHTDCVQGVGKIEINFQELGVDYLTFSGHKLGGIVGAGVIVTKGGAPLEPLLLGGGQEARLRAGTENLLAIAALGDAVNEILLGGEERRSSMLSLKKYLTDKLSDEIEQLRVNFTDRPTLPNTLSLTIKGIEAQDFVVALDLLGVGISAGSACSSGKPHGSSILKHLGFTSEEVRSTMRLSLCGRESKTELDYVAQAFKSAFKKAFKDRA
jgi:cysteine desulfurase